jgi:hypothetical protein
MSHTQPAGYRPYRVMVMALDDEGGAVAIGPVVKDESIEKIREQIESRGWTCYGQPRVMSAAEWKRECKKEGATR